MFRFLWRIEMLRFKKLIESIENHNEICDGVSMLQNCFDEDELKYLEELFETKTFNLIELQKHLPRKSYQIDPHNDCKPSDYGIFLDYLKSYFTKEFEEFCAILWEDGEGYKLDKHIDNERVPFALQIYLPSSANQDTGTKFYIGDEVHQVPFKSNVGYLCTKPTEYYHSSGKSVGRGEVRRSIYFIAS